MVERVNWYRDVLPIIAIVTVVCTSVGLATLFKAATLNGMSYIVFILYSYAIASLVMLPLPFIFRRQTVLPPFSLSVFFKICLLAVIGFATHVLGYAGLDYSSTILSSALSNLIPAYTFVLSVILRMEKLALRSSTTQAKIMGTIVSISGAIIVVLYKGPTLISASSSSSSISLHQPLGSSESNWVIGSILLAAAYLMLSIGYIVQAKIMKAYPNEMLVVFLYNLCGTIISAPVCLVAERNLSAWRIKADIALVTIVYSGFLGSSFNAVVYIWAVRIKGPVYISIFHPLSIVIAALMSVIFLGDSLYLGSVVGGIIISIGFFSVIWGKAKEEKGEDCAEVPLLQSHEIEET